MNKYPGDTIAAISTPHGRGAIGIVRLSGPRAIEIAGRLAGYESASSLEHAGTHTLRKASLRSGGILLDEALVAVMRRPQSYTGEDVVEFQCHGNPLVLEGVVTACIREGARAALPGEFTRRAFINGKIDLTRAEAIAGIIEAENERALKLALRQAGGALTRKIEKLKGELLDLLAGVEARLEFPEDEILEDGAATLLGALRRAQAECRELKAAQAGGLRLRGGVRVVIVGKPNAGKSSLFNALLHADRALVTAQRGTTRDAIEETVSLDGVTVTIVDTAGICGDHPDEAGKAGVERSKAAMERGDLMIFVADLSMPWTCEDEEIAALLKNKNVLLVLNKQDLPQKLQRDSFPAETETWERVSISATHKNGIDSIKKVIITYICNMCGSDVEGSAILCSTQQADALSRCADAVDSTVDLAQLENSEELIAAELRGALTALGDIVGETTSEELLDKIFSRFCIGK